MVYLNWYWALADKNVTSNSTESERDVWTLLINIDIPESLLLSTRQSYKEFETEAKKAIALKFYVDEKLSLGQAAELAGLGELEFITYLGKNNVSVFRFESEDYNDELQHDIQNAGKFANE